ncbi:restriction endonuclease [Rhizobium glycinendophyticum]|uniref:TIR domain-containing protein n=1 Tax=Rhizobium glycinendophyticum TaxID=2589807 RepID=A0A504TU68_9HYPH|nr:restriction endonuclease [Rhizobium glycinendophyticum]TPP04987.1 TIR domain-containing protein [Rhizobium glycinendophyticum]
MARMETCFIAAPLGAKTEVIRDVLRQRGLSVLTYDDLLPGSHIQRSIVEMIQKADLFICVVPGSSSASSDLRNNVFFELGIAMGVGRQVLVFAPSSGEPLPSDLHGLLTVRASLQNRDAIDFAISQVLAAPPRSGTEHLPTSKPKEEHGLGDEADSLWADYLDVRDRRDGVGFEKLVARVIRKSGIDVLSETTSSDRGVDLAIWSDSFHGAMGNPLLIQLKLKLDNRAQFKRVSDQLASAARNANSTWSLLIYGDGPAAASHWAANPTVLVISMKDLLGEMRGVPFTDVVRGLRNRRVHGQI